VFTKAFQKVPVMRKRRGDKVYEYGYVWITLPPEAAGKPAIVRVFVLEEEPVEEKPLTSPTPERKAPAPEPRPEPAPQPVQRPQPAQPAAPQPATPRPAQPVAPQPALPRPQQTQLRPPAQPPAQPALKQPQVPLLPPHRILSEPLPPLQPSRSSLSPELASLLTLRSRPEQLQLRDLLPFEEFTLGEEEKEEGKRKRRLFGLRWP